MQHHRRERMAEIDKEYSVVDVPITFIATATGNQHLVAARLDYRFELLKGINDHGIRVQPQTPMEPWDLLQIAKQVEAIEVRGIRDAGHVPHATEERIAMSGGILLIGRSRYPGQRFVRHVIRLQDKRADSAIGSPPS